MARQKRLRLICALAMVIALGLSSRLFPVGWHFYDKSLGDVLYATAAYLGIATVLNRWTPRNVAMAAFGFCIVIETFKLTCVPAAYHRWHMVRWLLGSTFSWLNIFWYACGIALALSLDVFVLRRKLDTSPW
jgi:hypothetical protein